MKISNTLKHAFTLAGLISFSPLAMSDVLVDQPYLPEGDSYLSIVDSGFENAESFTLSTAADITAITWWGTDTTDYSGFLIRLGSDLGEWSPLTGVVTKTATSDIDSEERAIYQFEQAFSSELNLATGTHFISISNEEDEWYWTMGSLDGSAGIAGNYWFDGDAWFGDESELSFRLIGTYGTGDNGDTDTTVPEPGVLALMLIGLLAGRKSLFSREV